MHAGNGLAKTALHSGDRLCTAMEYCAYVHHMTENYLAQKYVMHTLHMETHILAGWASSVPWRGLVAPVDVP
jgi:hypothetical protein